MSKLNDQTGKCLFNSPWWEEGYTATFTFSFLFIQKLSHASKGWVPRMLYLVPNYIPQKGKLCIVWYSRLIELCFLNCRTNRLYIYSSCNLCTSYTSAEPIYTDRWNTYTVCFAFDVWFSVGGIIGGNHMGFFKQITGLTEASLATSAFFSCGYGLFYCLFVWFF